MKEYYDEYRQKLVDVGNGIFINENTNDTYIMVSNKPVPLKDPISGSKLVPVANGIFHSDNLNGDFIYDEKKNSFIPLFIADLTQERAHIEGEYLVGNESGRRFPITPWGEVLLPYNKPKNLRTIEEINEEKNRLMHMGQLEINQIINRQLDEVHRSRELHAIDEKITLERQNAINVANERVEAIISDTEEKLRERQEKINKYVEIMEKIYEKRYISDTELQLLRGFVDDGVITEETYNDVMRVYSENDIQTARKI